jgi:hypothetical protein
MQPAMPVGSPGAAKVGLMKAFAPELLESAAEVDTGRRFQKSVL